MPRVTGSRKTRKILLQRAFGLIPARLEFLILDMIFQKRVDMELNISRITFVLRESWAAQLGLLWNCFTTQQLWWMLCNEKTACCLRKSDDVSWIFTYPCRLCSESISHKGTSLWALKIRTDSQLVDFSYKMPQWCQVYLRQFNRWYQLLASVVAICFYISILMAEVILHPV